MEKCKYCGGNMKPLLLPGSWFCPSDCDLKETVQESKSDVIRCYYYAPGLGWGEWDGRTCPDNNHSGGWYFRREPERGVEEDNYYEFKRSDVIEDKDRLAVLIRAGSLVLDSDNPNWLGRNEV